MNVGKDEKEYGQIFDALLKNTQIRLQSLGLFPSNAKEGSGRVAPPSYLLDKFPSLDPKIYLNNCKEKGDIDEELASFDGNDMNQFNEYLPILEKQKFLSDLRLSVPWKKLPRGIPLLSLSLSRFFEK